MEEVEYNAISKQRGGGYSTLILACPNNDRNQLNRIHRRELIASCVMQGAVGFFCAV